MPINIDFNESEANDLIEMYLDRLKSKKEEIFNLEKDIKEISAKVVQLKRALNVQVGNAVISPILNEEIYSEKWQWVKKIEFAIGLAKKPLTVNEIVNMLCELEPSLLTDRRRAMSSVSGTISTKSGEYEHRRTFIKSESESGEFAYDLWKEKQQPIETQTYGNTIIIDDLPF